MKAGFIGLGTMGASMAANLQNGFQTPGNTVLVHDVRREAAEPHIRNGAVWADSPAALAAEWRAAWRAWRAAALSARPRWVAWAGVCLAAVCRAVLLPA